MKKIFESKLYSECEFPEKVHVYQIENDEFWKLYTMSHKERCEKFGVFDKSDYEVAPGAVYRAYKFELFNHHIVMVETIALNV